MTSVKLLCLQMQESLKVRNEIVCRLISHTKYCKLTILGTQIRLRGGGTTFCEPPKPVEIRTKFPETWMFDNLEFDSG